MLPPVLVYAAALTAGVLSAIALQIYLARAGYGVAPLWERLSSTRTLNCVRLDRGGQSRESRSWSAASQQPP